MVASGLLVKFKPDEVKVSSTEEKLRHAEGEGVSDGQPNDEVVESAKNGPHAEDTAVEQRQRDLNEAERPG